KQRMSLLLTLAKEYANLTKDKKSCKLLSQGTVSSYTTFKKWTTSRKEKNPSLRMRWAMGSKFPIMANREILEEAGIPEQWEGIDLWSKKDDVSKLGMVLASPAAITYWNFCGPGVDNSSVIKDVYKAKFMKKERWRETLWGPMNFELVGKQRRVVETQPVEIKLNQKEIKELELYQLDEVKDAVGLIPKRMLGAYSYQARQLIQSQIKNDSYSLPEIIKLLPFCYSPPKKMLFDGTFHFKNQMYVRPGINTNLFSFSKTDKSKIYVNGSAVKIKLVLGDDEMDTSLAFVEGFQVCEYDPRAPLIPRRDLRLIGFGKKVRVFVGQGQEKTLVRTSSKRAASHDVSKNIRRMRLEV
ncbi:hypothetical protein, partial [Phaeobacter inhibens]|uniref:hypothetical protein n=1 Tax=Phaeobacter inhibens TaxID=221822 RepID=UPI0039EEDC17